MPELLKAAFHHMYGLFAALVLLPNLIALVVFYRRYPRDYALLFSHSGVTFLWAAGLTYGAGLVHGGFFVWAWRSTLCVEALHLPDDMQSKMIRTTDWFPPSQVCRFPNGEVQQLVPSWANPALYACLACAAVCIAAALWAWARSRPPARR